MIYHDNKYISFGSGDVCVDSSLRGMHFQNIKPPQECGTPIYRGQQGIEFIGELVELSIVDTADCLELEKKLTELELKQTYCIEYRGWRLYFQPGSEVSLALVRKHFDRVKTWVVLPEAC